MADISPELAEKIRELSGRYEENPGRFFVPLANAYRDAGQITQAEELLRSGLKHHPGYLSAYIVLGRCLADRGALEEAANEFRYVLSIDPQNLIALRALGDMAASAGRSAEAKRWYEELLAVDPMSKEVREALDALRSAPDPDPDPEQQPAEPLGADAHEPAAAFGLTEIAPLDTGATGDAGEGSELGDFGIVDPDAPAPDAALAGGEPSESRSSPPSDDVRLPEPLAPSSDLPALDLSADPYEPSAEESADSPAWAAPEDEEIAADERPREYDAFSFDSPGTSFADAVPSDAPSGWTPATELGELGYAGDADHFPEQEVVTETMAELYARQGFHERAIDVYRELIRQRGNEPALVRRLAELEVISGKTPLPEPNAALIDTPLTSIDGLMDTATEDAELPVLEMGLPRLDFSPVEPLPFEPLDGSDTVDGADAAPLVASDATGDDAFAASFENGFDAAVHEPREFTPEEPGATPPEADASSVGIAAEATELAGDDLEVGQAAPAVDFARAPQYPGADADSAPLAGANAEWANEPPPQAGDAAPALEAQPNAASVTIGAFLAGLLAWRGHDSSFSATQAAESAATSVEEPSPATADLPLSGIAGPVLEATPWEVGPDSEQEGAGDESPGTPDEAHDLPWMMPDPAEPRPAEDEPAPWEAAPSAGDEPTAAEPVDVSDLALDSDGAAGSSSSPDGAELLPWEIGTDAAPPATQTPAPEAPSGFSFEDFFASGGTPPSQPPSAPSADTPQTPPAPSAPAPMGSDADEDLESFQAWLQSLKR